MGELLSGLSLVFAVGSTLSFLRNYRAFQVAPRVALRTSAPVSQRVSQSNPAEAVRGSASHELRQLPNVSVLIPARDEADRIRRTLVSVLANTGIDFEVVVLDDDSQDDTAAIVQALATEDARVRLVTSTPLPVGWCGKQYACHQLAEFARYEELLFIDADVTLANDAIRRAVALRTQSGVALLSGFPRQIVRTLGEAMLIPLMHIVLLTYLPFRLMRTTTMPSASAGCGQFFLTGRASYAAAGGHASIKSSMHDGVTLPRSYRRAGLRTDVFDASDIASCRMYDGWIETLKGLLKNAHEGLANSRLLVPSTALLAMGFMLPICTLIYQLLWQTSAGGLAAALLAAAFSYVPRLLTAIRFDRSWLAALLFPLSILIFITLQWIAFIRLQFGAQSTWRGRGYTPTTA